MSFFHVIVNHGASLTNRANKASSQAPGWPAPCIPGLNLIQANRASTVNSGSRPLRSTRRTTQESSLSYPLSSSCGYLHDWVTRSKITGHTVQDNGLTSLTTDGVAKEGRRKFNPRPVRALNPGHSGLTFFKHLNIDLE